MTTQFSGLSLSGQQAALDSTTYHHQQQYAESGVPSSTRTTSPMYVSSVTQAGVTGQMQYVVLPHSGMQSQVRPLMQGQTYGGQAASPQQYQGYVVSPTQTPYQQFSYGTIPKDVTSSVIQQHARSQTPPTPPQTASPALTNQFMPQQQHPQAQLTFSSQIPQQSSQQTHTTPYQQQAPSPHTPQQLLRPMVPVVIQGGRGVAMATAVGQQGPVATQFQQAPVHVQAQYPSNQRRIYNIDRRVPKAGDIYSSDAAVMQGSHSLVSYGDGTIPTGYDIQGERGQYNHYQYQRYVL